MNFLSITWRFYFLSKKDHKKTKIAFKIKGIISEQATQSSWPGLIFQSLWLSLWGMAGQCISPDREGPTLKLESRISANGNSAWPWSSGHLRPMQSPVRICWGRAPHSPAESENHPLMKPSKWWEMPYLWVRVTVSKNFRNLSTYLIGSLHSCLYYAISTTHTLVKTRGQNEHKIAKDHGGTAGSTGLSQLLVRFSKYTHTHWF